MRDIVMFTSKPIAPCKDCMDHAVGCHGSCDVYQTWKAEYEAKRDAIKDAKRKQYDLDTVSNKRWKGVQRTRKDWLR